MRFTNSLLLATFAVAVAASAPAAAVVTTFASFNANNAGNIFYLNNGTGGTNTTYRSNGRGGTISTTNSAFNVRPANAVAGATPVSFSFLNSLSPFVTNLPALFNLNATVTSSPVATSGTLPLQFKTMTGFSGSFSFVTVSALTIGSTNYAAGSNLLSGTFSTGTIFGLTGGTSGSLSGSTPTSTIVYTSDFLDFSNTIDRDYALSLTGITSLVSNVNRGLNNTSGNAFRSFRSTATGSFSSDPAPLVPGVPEPQTWGLMILGFGMVGIAARRRKTAVAA